MFNPCFVNLITKLKTCFTDKAEPENLRRGKLGELAARKFLQKQGLKFLAANFRSKRGEIDLIFRTRDGFLPAVDPGNAASSLKNAGGRFIGNGKDCLVFVEVKTRAEGGWVRPAKAVNARKRLLLTKCAFDYLRLLKTPPVKIRFDVVEVLLEGGAVAEIRHLPDTFTLSAPYRYG